MNTKTKFLGHTENQPAQTLIESPKIECKSFWSQIRSKFTPNDFSISDWEKIETRKSYPEMYKREGVH
jgi:hypothetical protein